MKSVTVVHRAPDPFWRTKVPYAVALVNTDEGPVLMGHADEGVRIGDRVKAHLFVHADQQLVRFVKCDSNI
ncbi:MAG: OB-fold domain-containing protein [Burkholderiaceae bacterium]|nr:OB-fold domain-containing protein [Burkholderiaceae bacterium]MCD8516417.1 OB-fold domain-containing protein [Burkholderiaceae bacterium]MCD8536848.1 OB-fold domain-containing protein [Burkholderiaceae bacterium]MCD8565480.1 OB-fold domain-containing protein [Burkholderiaceae bacterium]